MDCFPPAQHPDNTHDIMLAQVSMVHARAGNMLPRGPTQQCCSRAAAAAAVQHRRRPAIQAVAESIDINTIYTGVEADTPRYVGPVKAVRLKGG